MNSKLHIRYHRGFQPATEDKKPDTQIRVNSIDSRRDGCGGAVYQKQVPALLKRNRGPEHSFLIMRTASKKVNAAEEFTPQNEVQGLRRFVLTAGVNLSQFSLKIKLIFNYWLLTLKEKELQEKFNASALGRLGVRASR